MSTVVSNSNHWPGFSSIKRLFIFGDSYSSVFYQHDGYSAEKHPTAEEPLGIEFPGFTFNEPDLPNWVGHLLMEYCPPPRFNPSKLTSQDPAWDADPLLVYNYARGGDVVDGIARQVRRLFLPIVGKKPDWALWNENNSLFVTSVGINDCAVGDNLVERQEKLWDLQEELYQAGARNFLFFDVPPIDQAPAIAEKRIRYGIEVDRSEETTYQKWNRTLRDGIDYFKKQHPDCTIMVFSLYQTFSVILEDLETYGFPPSHRHASRGQVWVDHLHPSSRIHELIAHFLCDFLSDVPVLKHIEPPSENGETSAE